ncbi:hypothetical protein RN001_002947 [Aquatica leii]|uniref:Uncharacterized protein n=1 Tax=Aquatica leii TaxID=1421715 RepID=A0AAN7PN09_9COLE|nr:hypothetical protein RN001_002947 [Aquatica leii]
MTFSYYLISSLFIGLCLTEDDFNATQKNVMPDYYWRDYVGIIPNDALPGGFDKSRARTYIGQILTKDLLLPATIHNGSKTSVASANGETIYVDNFVKILCTRNRGRYRWVTTENSKTHLLTNFHLVIGGTEAGYVLNIGRVAHDMQVIVGKVFAHHTPYKGLTIPYNNTEITYQSYELLVYQIPEYTETPKPTKAPIN